MHHTQVNLIHLKTFELEIDFAEYIQCRSGVQIADLCWAPIYHLPSNVLSANVDSVYINLQP